MMSVAAFSNRRWIGVNGASTAEDLGIRFRLCLQRRYCASAELSNVLLRCMPQGEPRIHAMRWGSRPLQSQAAPHLLANVGSFVLLEDRANVVQAWDETAAVGFLAAAGAMRKSHDVRAVLAKSGIEGKALGVVDQRQEACLAVGVVAHQDGELAAWCKSVRTVAKELAVTDKELVRRPRTR